MALLAGAVALLTDVAYLLAIAAQDPSVFDRRVQFIGAAVAVLAVGAWLGAILLVYRPGWASTILRPVGVGLIAIGILGILSLGFPWLAAGTLALIAGGPACGSFRGAAAGSGAVVLGLALGIVLTAGGVR